MKIEPGDILFVYYPAGVTLPSGWMVRVMPNATRDIVGEAYAVYRDKKPELPATFRRLVLCRAIQSIE